MDQQLQQQETLSELVNLRQVNEHLYIDVATQTLLYSPEYEQDLQAVKSVITEAEALIAQDIDEANDDQVDNVRNQIADLIKKTEVVKDTRKALSDFMKETRETVLDIFDNHANSLGYDKLPLIQTKTKNLRDKQLARRKEKRWLELETTFKETLPLYPNIPLLAPKLADFNDFKIKHPKLVTGDKNKNIGKKQRAEVSEYLNNVSELLTTWEQNQLGLSTIYHNQLLSSIMENPSKEVFFVRQTALLQQQQADERTRLEQERFRQEQEAAKLAQAQQQGQVVTPQPSQPIPMQDLKQNSPQNPLLQQEAKAVTRPIGELTREWLSNHVMISSPAYDDVATNVSTKVALIHDIMHQLDAPNTSFSMWIRNTESLYFRDDLIADTLKQVLYL